MNSKKGFVIPLIIALVAIFAIGGGVFVYQNKKVEAPVVDHSYKSSTYTQEEQTQARERASLAAIANETKDWKTYTNAKYGFEFKYPSNIQAWDAVDYTNGQIPDIAGFGYLTGEQRDRDNLPPADKLGSARILVWNNVSEDLISWLNLHEVNIKKWTDTKVGGVAAVVNYSVATTSRDGVPMTFKIYYVKFGNKIFEIMGVSVTNQYSDTWISVFDKVIPTFKFTNSTITNPVACTMDAMMCADGTYVGRSGPKCEFICPNIVQEEIKIYARFDKNLSGSFGADYFLTMDENNNLYKFIYDDTTIQNYCSGYGIDDSPYCEKGNFNNWLKNTKDCWSGALPEVSSSSESMDTDFSCWGFNKNYLVGKKIDSQTIKLIKVISPIN